MRSESLSEALAALNLPPDALSSLTLDDFAKLSRGRPGAISAPALRVVSLTDAARIQARDRAVRIISAHLKEVAAMVARASAAKLRLGICGSRMNVTCVNSVEPGAIMCDECRAASREYARPDRVRRNRKSDYRRAVESKP